MRQRRFIGVAVLLSWVIIESGQATAWAVGPVSVDSASALATVVVSSSSNTKLTPTARAQALAVDLTNPMNSTGLPLALQQHCFSSAERQTLSNPKPCIFGNPRSTITVVLFGSSAVDDWTPALKIAATRLNIRVATFQYEGCYTPFVTGLGHDCTTFHQNLPRAISALHPQVVMAVAAADSAGAAGDEQYVSGMQRAFEAVGQLSPNARRVLWGTTPRMNAPVPSCLIMRPRTIKSCGLTYSPSSTAPHSYGQILRRDATTAQRANATLVPVSSWFCTATFCPAVIGDRVVYVDFLHVSATYSRYLATMVTTQLRTLVAPVVTTTSTTQP
jgi:SGNH domain (fused to AT3 domains)